MVGGGAGRQVSMKDESPTPACGQGPRRLLVIDDESNMRHMLAAMLKNSGYSVDTASEGLEGMKMLERSSYDFILCDIKMPKMDGMTFLKTAGDLVEHSTVIMMSAYGTVETALEAMKLGAMDFVEKPADLDKLTAIIKKAQARKMVLIEKKIENKMKDIISHKGW